MDKNINIPPTGESDAEKIKKSEVIAMLKEKGFDDPKTKELILKWTEQKEKEVEKEGTPKARLLFNIERIDLFMQVDINWAWESTKEVFSDLNSDRSSTKEELDELYGILYKKMDEIGYPKDDSNVKTDEDIDYYTKK